MVQTESDLFNLSTDIWNDYLCHYIGPEEYTTLWETMDRRLHALLSQLHLDYISLKRDDSHRSRMLQVLCLRTKRFIHVVGRTDGDCIGLFASSATSIKLTLAGIKGPITFAQWPNLQSLFLGSVRSDSDTELGASAYSITSVLNLLPSSLIELVLHGKSYHGARCPMSKWSSDKLMGLIYRRLPRLAKLHIINHALAVPFYIKGESVGGAKYQWPPHLTDLSLSLTCEKPEPSLVLHLNLPQSVTSLSLFTVTTGALAHRSIIRVSSLPPIMSRLDVGTYTLDLDAPWPTGLTYLSFGSIAPDYGNLPFTLPPTLTYLSPLPAKADLHKFGANIRIIARLGMFYSPLSLDENIDRDWKRVEDAFSALPLDKPAHEIKKAAHAFTSPIPPWSFTDSLEAMGLYEVLMPRMARTLNDAEVSSANCTRLLLTHANWLKVVRMTSPAAAEAFFEYVIASTTVEDHPRVPHLLTTLMFRLQGSCELTLSHMMTVIERYPSFKMPNVLMLILHVAYQSMTSAELAMAISKLFPCVRRLEITYSAVMSPAVSFYSASELVPLLSGIPMLKTVHVTPLLAQGISGFNESPEEFLSFIPANITTATFVSGYTIHRSP